MTSFYENLKAFLFQPKTHFLPPHIPVRPNLQLMETQEQRVQYYAPEVFDAHAEDYERRLRPRKAEACGRYAKDPWSEMNSSCETSSSEYDLLQMKTPVVCLPKLQFKLQLEKGAPHVDDDSMQVVCYLARQDKLTLFLPQINFVCANIYISGCIPAQDLRMLAKYNIRAVLNLCGDVVSEPANRELSNFIVRVKDGTSEAITEFFYECFAFIHYHRYRGENVLIHCHQGVSRSSTITLAYLMLSNDVSFVEAFSHLRTCRGVVAPNSGFICQLIDWWAFRHQNSFAFIRCKNIAQALRLEIKFDIKQAAQKESAVRDLLGNTLVKCALPADQNLIKPVVFKLTHLCIDQPLLVLKRVPKPRDDRYLLDSRFIYIVSQFHNVTVALIGNDVQGDAQDCQLDSFCVSARARCTDVASEPDYFVEKNDQPELWQQWLKNPIDPSQLFISDRQRYAEQIHEQLKALDVNNLLKKALARQLLLMMFFEHFSDKIVVYQQDQMLEKQRHGILDFQFVHLCDCLGWCSYGNDKKYGYSIQRYPLDSIKPSSELLADRVIWQPLAENDEEFGVFQRVIM